MVLGWPVSWVVFREHGRFWAQVLRLYFFGSTIGYPTFCFQYNDRMADCNPKSARFCTYHVGRDFLVDELSGAKVHDRAGN